MKSFRHWIFKLITGYDLVEYSELLRTTRQVLDYATDIHEQNKKICDFNQRVLDNNQQVLKLSYKAINDCRNVLRLCGKVDENETLG